ncbi:16381_t:CDS:2 [Rhizophagus irregularis]|nr:16381_t:CDS:2 [Rhizophagus irregularis]
MTHETASTPHTNDCIKSDHRMFFTFDPEKSSFLSGYLGINVTTITGTLLVRFTQAIKARKINLYFIGREKVEWVHLRKIKKEKIILKQHEILWESNNPIGYELITDLTLPFEFQVPSNAIESIDSNFGHVQYTLKAVINKKINKKFWIEVKVPIWRWARPSIEELKPLIIKSKSSQQRRHQIEWETILPKTFFDINSNFKIKLRMIVQDPDLRIKKISGGGSNKQYLYKGETINGKDVVMTPSGLDTLFEANILINIPDDVIPTCKTNYMKIINEIQIKVMFERSNTYVLITREILIGRNYETRVEN